MVASWNTVTKAPGLNLHWELFSLLSFHSLVESPSIGTMREKLAEDIINSLIKEHAKF